MSDPGTRVVHLIHVGGDGAESRWSLGRRVCVGATPRAISEATTELLRDESTDAILYWDAALGAPPVALVASFLEGKSDAWHAGVKLGMGEASSLLVRVMPVWMLARPAPATIESNSWHVSLRAALVRADVLRRLGGPSPEFETLAGASLELGHRLFAGGAFLRYVPGLLDASVTPARESASLDDDLRFIRYRFGKNWLLWAAARSPSRARALRRVPGLLDESGPHPAPITRPSITSAPLPEPHPRVTAILPTIDRVPYLRVILDQLRKQTIPPIEVIVVDQTPLERRDRNLLRDFADLPLQVIEMEEPGQCRSRNAALERATGDYILFVDDDIEVAPQFVEYHLRALSAFGADCSSGPLDEPGVEVGKGFAYPRMSDVFPGCNTLVRRRVLESAGLFDMAFDRGQRADGDLGRRAYLSGASMAFTPEIRVLHHRAPRGGLRIHGARTTTYSGSRTKLLERQLASATEFYMAARYCGDEAAREVKAHSVLGTFRVRGNVLRQVAKAALAVARLPDTLRRVNENSKRGYEMLQRFPQIPQIPKLAKVSEGGS